MYNLGGNKKDIQLPEERIPTYLNSTITMEVIIESLFLVRTQIFGALEDFTLVSIKPTMEIL